MEQEIDIKSKIVAVEKLIAGLWVCCCTIHQNTTGTNTLIEHLGD